MAAAKSRNVCFHTTGIVLLLLTIAMLLAGFVLVCVFARPESGYWAGVGGLVAGALCSVCVTCYACLAFRRKASLFGCIKTSLPAAGGPRPQSLEEGEEGQEEHPPTDEHTDTTKLENHGQPIGEWPQRNGHSHGQPHQRNGHANEDLDKGVERPNGNAGEISGGQNGEVDVHKDQRQPSEQVNGRFVDTDAEKDSTLHQLY
ncbi:hypothetical protein NP493_383g04033 [Ridgeia piscesae]|uniref:Uncharacterized protein n=1 Tax=Ridgeia piscesae TaxID=27915 RepID=A0AAD9L385_RIDPI|nr:hypothetical protein NP493_383g04033 [Ridgeia piscesae]